MQLKRRVVPCCCHHGANVSNQWSEQQKRRWGILLSHLSTESPTQSVIELCHTTNQRQSDTDKREQQQSNSSLLLNESLVSSEEEQNKSEEESLNLISLACISQLTSLTSKSLDVYRNALYKFLNQNYNEEDLNGQFDLQSWTYSLSQLSSNLSYLLLSYHNSTNAVGIKNSSYLATAILSLCNLSLSILLNRSVNDKFYDYVNQRNPKQSEKTLSSVGQLMFVILNCLAHMSSGVLQRNASLIVDNYSTVQKQRLMTAYYFILSTGSKIWTGPLQSIIIERYGLSIAFFITSIFCMACMPLFYTLEIEEFRGENHQKIEKDQKPSSMKKKNHKMPKKHLKERISSILKTASYLCFLFASFTGKDILYSQSHSTLEVCGRMGAKRASTVSAIISIANIVVNRLLNLSQQFAGNSLSQESTARYKVSTLLLIQNLSLIASILSKSSKMFAISFATFSVSLSLMNHHLVKAGLDSTNSTDEQSKLNKFRILFMPIISALMPTIFSMIRNKFLYNVKMSPLRLNLILLFIIQIISSIFFQLMV
jgi:hypothetical protein